MNDKLGCLIYLHIYCD